MRVHGDDRLGGVAGLRLLVLLGLAALIAACSSSTEQEATPGAATSRAPRAEEQLTDSGPSQQDRSASMRDAEQQMARLRGQVEGLRRRAEIAGVESASAAEQRIAAAERDFGAVERRVEAIQQASDAEWASAVSAAEQALSDLGGDVDRAEAEIRELSENQRAERIAAIEPLLARGLIEGLDGATYLAYRPAFIEQVQERLADVGLYDGPIDGYLELTTQRALGEFQKRSSLLPSGVPTPKTRAAMTGSSEGEEAP